MPKYRTLTMKEKVAIIEAARSATCSKTRLAQQFSVPSSTLSTILKNSEKIVTEYGKTYSSKRSRVRTSAFSELETALIAWLNKMTAANLLVNGSILRDKARDLADQLGCENFSCSNGWFCRFKTCHNLTYLNVCGESGSVNEEVVSNWRSHTLQPLLEEFRPDDLFNLDEAALFYKMLPDRTFTATSKATGKKQKKDRISVLFGANASGSEKLPLLIIGKYAKPRCFKNARLPSTNEVIYRSNTKAWVTSALFEEYVRVMDRKFSAKGRRVVFVVDNCSAHGAIQNLQAIRIVFLPPNTTAISQPMDQGVILQTRKIYRSHLLRRMLLCYENGKDYEIDLLGAISLMAYSWKLLKSSVIEQCFRHAGFFSPDTALDSTEGVTSTDTGEDDDVSRLWEQTTMQSPDGAANSEDFESFDDYVRLDEKEETCATTTAEDIILSATDVNSGNDDGGDEPPRVPSFSEVLGAVGIVRGFVEANGAHSDMMDLLARLERTVTSEGSFRTRQTKISDFFLSLRPYTYKFRQ
ncbi:tigger transposable element-derived protein 4-like [Ornithodoros turicata]|uniref:tigger transposable element-derived protein 4-like n=1 Tax=Ornithodoros turicata TaxID=34597 RepID=UPI0031397D0F